MPYRYERGEHRRKHCWSNDYAGFTMSQGNPVGKCPNTISQEVAETVLNQAVAEPDPFALPGRQAEDGPKRLYAVYRGVIYEAVRTQPGSYHAYPWRAKPGRAQLPLDVMARLEQMAIAEGYLEEFKDWLDQYGPW